MKISLSVGMYDSLDSEKAAQSYSKSFTNLILPTSEVRLIRIKIQCLLLLLLLLLFSLLFIELENKLKRKV